MVSLENAIASIPNQSICQTITYYEKEYLVSFIEEINECLSTEAFCKKEICNGKVKEILAKIYKDKGYFVTTESSIYIVIYKYKTDKKYYDKYL